MYIFFKKGRDFQMGLTKVFFRAGKLQFLDELTNNSKESMHAIVGKVKKWLARYNTVIKMK